MKKRKGDQAWPKLGNHRGVGRTFSKEGENHAPVPFPAQTCVNEKFWMEGEGERV